MLIAATDQAPCEFFCLPGILSGGADAPSALVRQKPYEQAHMAWKGTVSPMGKTVEYQGYTIQSTPQYVTDWEKWLLCIVISMQDPQGIRSREFSSKVLYATEQEADIHGIGFGHHLIDGKVPGLSVADMKTTDRRATPRLCVQFRTTFSDATKLEGIGTMLDVSLGGCRIESPVPVEPGLLLELRVYAPDIGWPLMIEAASVQWVSGQTFGLAFFRITEAEQQRLGQMIHDLQEES